MAIDWQDKVGAPCVAVFGEPVAGTYRPYDTSLASYPLNPVFDEAYREVVLLDGESATSDVMPVAGVNDSQFKSVPRQNDMWQRQASGQWYMVKEVRPDGHGITLLKLLKSDAPS